MFSRISQYLEAGVLVDKGLPEAIRSGHEIMFTSGSCIVPQYSKRTRVTNAYIAVPAVFDEQLRSALGISYTPRRNPREVFNNDGRVITPWERTYSVP